MSSSSLRGFLLVGTLFLIFVAIGANGVPEGTTTDVTVTAHTKNRLHVIPLIPGDSPEARRRRRERRQRQRRLVKEEKKSSSSSDSSKKEDDESSTKQEEGEPSDSNSKEAVEQEQDENPLTLHRDVLYEGYGVHYVDLWVGCPSPQRTTVIVDTGSSVTGFPCAGCHRCGGDADSNEDEHIQYHTDALFQQDQSTCFEKLQSEKDCLVGWWDNGDKICRTSKHYSEGSSWDAFEATDQVYTGGDHNKVDMKREEQESFKLHFACQESVTGLFETQVQYQTEWIALVFLADFVTHI